MMKWLFAVVLVGALCASRAEAGVLYNFYGTTEEGSVGSAKLDVDVVGLTLIATLTNTSPNEAYISAFGFDLTEPVPSLLSWSLSALDKDGVSVVIGNDTNDGDFDYWQVFVNADSGNQSPGAGLGSLSLDILTGNTGTGNRGRLYNGDLAPLPEPGGQEKFYTDAVLTMAFNSEPELFAWQESLQNGSPWVRFQGVGEEDDSLKLVGTPETNGTPEPSSWLVMLGSLAGLAYYRRRYMKV